MALDGRGIVVGHQAADLGRQDTTDRIVMGVGRRPREQQQESWITTEVVAVTPKHVFCDKLNEVLDEGGFDDFVEDLCEPCLMRRPPAIRYSRPAFPDAVHWVLWRASIRSGA